ncbi:MAG: hypothetical protein ACAH83_09535 [Alphaproteobacteria bacterium]
MDGLKAVRVLAAFLLKQAVQLASCATGLIPSCLLLAHFCPVFRRGSGSGYSEGEAFKGPKNKTPLFAGPVFSFYLTLSYLPRDLLSHFFCFGGLFLFFFID